MGMTPVSDMGYVYAEASEEQKKKKKKKKNPIQKKLMNPQLKRKKRTALVLLHMQMNYLI